MSNMTKDMIEDVLTDFSEYVNNSKEVKRFLSKFEEVEADFESANLFSIEVGEKTADIFFSNIKKRDIQLNLKTDYEQVGEVLTETLKCGHNLVSEYNRKTQERHNQKNGVDVKPISTKFNKQRAEGITKHMKKQEEVNEEELREQIVNFTQSVTDKDIEENFKLLGELGLQSIAKRNATSNACSWCQALVGVYIYPDVPHEVFQRHKRCKCSIVYRSFRTKDIKTF